MSDKPKRHAWSCLNPEFKYVPAAATDVAVRFRRILRAQAKWREANAKPSNVTPLVSHSREIKRK